MEIDSFIQRADYLELFPEFNNQLDDVAPNIRPVHKENLKVPTRAGYMVRSKSEAIIVSLLMDAEIEFYYERPISLAGNWFVPDFTCINRSNKKVYYYEHFGMVDNDEYNKNMYKKLKTYNDNFWTFQRKVVNLCTKKWRKFDFTKLLEKKYDN